MYLLHSTCLINAIYYNYLVSSSFCLYPSPVTMISDHNFSGPANVLPSALYVNHSSLGDIVQAVFLISPGIPDSLKLFGHFVV